jgi:hypothetical protein
MHYAIKRALLVAATISQVVLTWARAWIGDGERTHIHTLRAFVCSPRLMCFVWTPVRRDHVAPGRDAASKSHLTLRGAADALMVHASRVAEALHHHSLTHSLAHSRESSGCTGVTIVTGVAGASAFTINPERGVWEFANK